MSVEVQATLQLAYARAIIRQSDMFTEAMMNDMLGEVGLRYHIAGKEVEHCYEVLSGYTHGNMDKWTVGQAKEFILEWERKLYDGDQAPV
jgi:hypothetical protein